MTYKSLLLESVEVKLHFKLAEQFDNGCHDATENGGLKEAMVVDFVEK